MESLITVLTATFNRAHLLPELYASLCRQTCQQFQWLIVDDGSTDETELLVKGWISAKPNFIIKLIRKDNGGKNRAINDGVKLIKTPFTMIVDSDDFLTDYAIEFLSIAADKTLEDNCIAGVVGLRGEKPDTFSAFSIDDFVLASNLERQKYQLENDANEVYKTEILRSHPFEVWPDETFVPEETVWNQLALEGYKLRWYKLTTCIVRYQDDGMTRNSWTMLKKNPIGYAKMFNQRYVIDSFWWSRINNTLQFVSCCLLAKNSRYLLKSNNVMLAFVLFFPGWLLCLRRRRQIVNYCRN